MLSLQQESGIPFRKLILHFPGNPNVYMSFELKMVRLSKDSSLSGMLRVQLFRMKVVERKDGRQLTAQFHVFLRAFA
jgi:hypothetical protein